MRNPVEKEKRKIKAYSRGLNLNYRVGQTGNSELNFITNHLLAHTKLKHI